jgi:probable selenium-dependent hydroxylase accessory protein YqeC
VILPVLGIRRGQVVAVAGAGGKTTLVYRLAAEARDRGLSVLVTTTTHMGTLPEAVTGPVFVDADGDPEPAVRAALEREGRATLLGRRVREDKLEGLGPERVDALAALADVVLVEADGARGRSLKVPAPHEPVIPLSTALLVVVCALDVLGARLDEGLVHRVELVSAATGTRVGSVVEEDGVAAALRHPAGYLARAPQGARVTVFLNKVEDESGFAAAARLSRRLVPPYESVVAGSARTGVVRAWPPAA